MPDDSIALTSRTTLRKNAMLKKIYLIGLSVSLLFFAGCSSIDVAVSNKYKKEKKVDKIVVFPFKIEGASCGSEFADAVSHQFVKMETLDVIEREALNKLIEEDKLAMSGIIDENKAKAIGKKLGVDAIVLGRGTAVRIKDFNCIRSFSLRMISVETGSIIVTARVAEGASPKYDDLAKELVREVITTMSKAEQMMPNNTPESENKTVLKEPVKTDSAVNKTAPNTNTAAPK
jgi:TolB-like protein